MMKKIYSEKSKQNIVNTYWCFLLLNRIPISDDFQNPITSGHSRH
ncbi:hypothetical protein [Chryseobacterium gallinarum]|nr:hypothetical protein [Chryseobacterium gallinarum]